MKKFEVELKYETYALYVVEANTEGEAKDKAWKLLNNDSQFDYGEWQIDSIKETKGE